EAATRHLDEAALAMNGEASRRNCSHLAGRQPLDGAEGARAELARIEEMEPPLAEHGPGAGRGIAAANEVEDVVHMVGPVDLRFALAHPTLIAGACFVLRALLRLSRGDQVGGLEQCRDAERKNLVEIEAADAVLGRDRHVLLKDDRPFVEAIDRAKDGEARARLAENDR